MQQRTLGRSGIAIAPLVFGGNVFGWTADQPRSFALLDRFIDQGFNAIDTADTYSSWAPGNAGGESETIIGKWLTKRGRRDDIVLMSKVGLWEKHKGLSAATIEAAVEDSLKRLQTDYLDIYFAHTDDKDVPLEESLEAFSRLVKAGKVRAIGASNYDAQRLQQALAVSEQRQLPRYEVMQPLYNLYDRAPFEDSLAQVAQQQEIGVVCYFALASGFLSGKYRTVSDLANSKRARMLQRFFDGRGEDILQALDEVSQDMSAVPAQVALAWLLTRPGVTAPIASATSLEQLDQILGAATLKLSGKALERLESASAISS